MRRTKEDALLTKESIMESALDVFIAKGYSRTTTQDIVNEIASTRGALYFHFKDKEDLFRQVVDRELKFISELTVDSFIASGNEKERIEQVIENVIQNFYSNDRFRKVVLLTWFRMEVALDSHVISKQKSFNEFFLEELTKLLKAASKRSLLKASLYPKETATHITALLLGMYRMYFVTPSYVRDVETSKKIVTTYLDQIFN